MWQLHLTKQVEVERLRRGWSEPHFAPNSPKFMAEGASFTQLGQEGGDSEGDWADQCVYAEDGAGAKES